MEITIALKRVEPVEDRHDFFFEIKAEPRIFFALTVPVCNTEPNRMWTTA
jgi:hypothetical protein